MAGDVAHDLATPGGVPDVDRALDVEVRRHGRQVVGVVVHVVTLAGLRRASVSTPVVREHAVAVMQKNSICVSQSSAESGQPWLEQSACPSPSP